MKIAIYTTMPLDNYYTGVHGITYFMFPLIKQLKKDGHDIVFCGNVVENKTKNIFCEMLKLKPYLLSIKNDITVDKDIYDCDLLLVYNRPPTNQEEYQEQNYYMSKFVKLKKPVLYWCGDLWFPPLKLSQKIVLLRPFKSKMYDCRFKASYTFNYFTHDFYNRYKLEDRPKIIDYLYIGNYYNRFDNFYNKFKDLKGNIVVAGNWLKNEEKAKHSIRLKNVLFIGEIPHCFSIPLYSISKKTFYVIPENYGEVKMATSRVYEAFMGHCGDDSRVTRRNTLVDAMKLLHKIIEAENDLG